MDVADVRIPVERWDRDHLSTLLYIETRCVDYDGVVDRRHMRCNPARHPQFAHLAWEPGDAEKYGTRLVDKSTVPGHDDWDCIDDLEEAGMLKWKGTGAHPVFVLTTKGRACAAELRRRRMEKAGTTT